MIILPAIDPYGKKAVRLYKGDYDNMTVYSDDPLSVAADFRRQGAEYIHIVDLEGARDGATPNLSVVEKIAEETGLFVEAGGGVRDMAAIDRYFAAGVKRVIIGTAAVNDRRLLSAAIDRYGGGIAVGADVRDGYVAVKGWMETSRYTLGAFMEEMLKAGVKTIICTDISRDGAMAGTNIELYSSLAKAYTVDMIASGGVSGTADIEKLRAMGLYGAIIGKAYYTGAIDLAQAIEVAK